MVDINRIVLQCISPIIAPNHIQGTVTGRIGDDDEIIPTLQGPGHKHRPEGMGGHRLLLNEGHAGSCLWRHFVQIFGGHRFQELLLAVVLEGLEHERGLPGELVPTPEQKFQIGLWD